MLQSCHLTSHWGRKFFNSETFILPEEGIAAVIYLSTYRDKSLLTRKIARLQRAQNCLARVLTKAPRFSRSVPILKWLHRLPVKFRIRFKICAITFWTLKDNQPACLTDLLVRQKCSQYLRSTNSNRFVVPRIKTRAQPYGTPCLCPYVMSKQF